MKTILITILVVCSCQLLFAQDFITRWKLPNSGWGSTSFIFGGTTSGPVSYTWETIPASASGSGTFSSTPNSSSVIIDNLPAGATIRLSINPSNFQRFEIFSSSERLKLTVIEQWGSTSWTTMHVAFYNCANLQVTATDIPNLSGVASMGYMFAGCTQLNSIPNINSWNTSTVFNMGQLFWNAENFNQPIDSWNTGRVTNMQAMFNNAKVFNQNISSWNTSNVRNMDAMFSGASAFNQNIGFWNTALVTTMRGMFAGAIAFNQDISNWNTGLVRETNGMFNGAVAFNQNIASWNMISNRNFTLMFSNASSFNQSLGQWAITGFADLMDMFTNSGMDCNNYSSTLIGWNANINTPNGRNLGAVGRQYGTQAIAARANLVLPVASGGKGWTIIDGGLSTGSCGVVGNTVSTPIFSGGQFCAGATISVSFSSTGSFVSGNQFNIQLSDANGSFSSPSIIGTATTAGNVNCTIPTSVAGGVNYRIRIVATNPSIIGNSNATAIAVNPQNWNLSSPTGNVLNSNSVRKAVQTINASNVISGLSIVDYRAGHGINLTPGFQVISSAGSSFKAEIGGCN